MPGGGAGKKLSVDCRAEIEVVAVGGWRLENLPTRFAGVSGHWLG
jgi:hypothetical protein